jgi:demethylmenaquinone methyltransferase/2-methoxy-6-polyprenyl-1,4-benzoquinol methylase
MSRDEGHTPLPPHPKLDRYYADPAGQRAFLDAMFEATAPHYGQLDGLVSLGSGPYYRRYALQRAGLKPGMVSLDVATGTGLVAQAARALVGPSGRVTGLDRNAGMLAEARRTFGLGLVQGMAEGLPFRGDRFDFLTMAYALRHVTDLGVTFGEYFRVLKPGGTVLILEFSRPRSRLGLAVGRLYLKRIVPWLARWRSGSREAEILMSYCWDTVEHCVPEDRILGALKRSGFEEVRRSGWFGVFVEYAARKPGPPRPDATA